MHASNSWETGEETAHWQMPWTNSSQFVNPTGGFIAQADAYMQAINQSICEEF
ncbi:MAG: hypothetical protein ACN6O3_17570 [Comamonas sp.]